MDDEHPERACTFDPAFFANADKVASQAQAHQREELQQQLREGAADGAPQPTADGALPFPPGLVGDVARFVYQSAPLPVREVAITAALGLMAGLCGRAWHTPTPASGLNLYIVLVGQSGIGKEAMHSGISKIMSVGIQAFPQFGNFVDFTDYVSGPALIKACSQNTSFVNVAGEIGHKFVEMSDAKSGSPMRNYRKQLTTLYSKSGPGNIMGGLGYSSQENNIEALQSVAYSLIGETTPGTFYESITDSMLADGFMSRFCIIEYTGDRPHKNRAPLGRPDQGMVDRLLAIAWQADVFIGNGHFQEVSLSPTAWDMLDRFDLECSDGVRAAGDDERLRAVWNRAHLNALRVACLLAVGDNHMFPVVTDEQAAWAITLMRHSTSSLLKRIGAGEVGEGSDGGREAKVLNLCKEFLNLPAGHKKLADYKRGEEMKQANIVPRRFLQQRTQRMSAFEKHKLGHTAALDMAIKTAIGNGNLIEVKREALVEQYDTFGKAYRVVNLFW
jgi:hypothetical protein